MVPEMTVPYEDIEKLIRVYSGTKKTLMPETRIVEDLGIYGDDFFELIESYAETFNVNMDGFLWYFHTREEGSLNPGALIFKTPDRRVRRIPVTIAMLKGYADNGKWGTDYPEHKIPEERWDVIITWVFFTIPILIMIIAAFLK